MPREVKARCGYETPPGTSGRHTKNPCDRPVGHPGGHLSGQVEHTRIRNGIRDNNPESPYYWTSREVNWRAQKILCIPTCVRNRGYLCRYDWSLLWTLQDGKCGICGGLMMRGKRSVHSDHAHVNPDGSGPIRGLLHGGRTGCNIRHLARWEKGYSFEGEDGERMAAACLAYVTFPPAARLAAAQGTPFPEGTCFVSVISPSKAITLDNYQEGPVNEGHQ